MTQSLVQHPFLPGREHLRVDVGLATHRRCVAQQPGDALQHIDAGATDRRLPGRHRQGAQQIDCMHGRVPGPEVLGREVTTHRFAEIIIYHAGIDRAARTVRSHVLKEMVTRQRMAAPNDVDDALAVNDDLVPHAALAHKIQRRASATREADMAAAQGGDAETVIVARILSVTDASRRSAQDSHGTRENLVAAELLERQVAFQATAQRRQSGDKVCHTIELRAVAYLAPDLMVAVLLTATRIAARRLKVPARCVADPDIMIGGRYCQGADATQGTAVADHVSPRCQVPERTPDAPARDSWHRIAYVHEAGASRRVRPLT